MWHRFSSTDRLPSTRSEVSRSPYAKNYRTNFTHDQREQLSHRQNISRLPRRELEDRHIALVDEHYALKKENAANNEKIRKMATKLLRLSAEGKSRGTPFPQQLSPNEHLEIQIIRLEAYNALLKERLNAVIKKYSNCVQSGNTSSIRRPASCSNLSIKRKIILSQDDLNLLEIPEPPTMMTKIDNRSSCESGSAITSAGRRQINKSASDLQSRHHKQHQYQHSQSSLLNENENVSNLQDEEHMSMNEDSVSINEQKSIKQRHNEISDSKANMDSTRRVNVVLEETVSQDMMIQQATENVQLTQMRQTMADCEAELHELRKQYLNLKSKAESELNDGHTKIDELTRIVHIEMEKNNKLSAELQAVRQATDNIESIQNNSNNEPKTKLMPDGDATDKTQIAVTKAMPKNDDDLPELLNEAKLTIIQLQEDVNSLKTQLEMLRKQNDHYFMEIREFKERNKEINEIEKSMQTSLVGAQETIHKYHQEIGGSVENTTPPIPLEPIIIVNDKNERRSSLRLQKAINDSATRGPDSTEEDHSNIDDQSFGSDDTFVITKEKRIKNKRDGWDYEDILDSSYNKDTDSEISSFNSDNNFQTFQYKNKKLQNALLLYQTHQSAPLSFEKRINLLERTAYYQPLTKATHSHITNENHFLACNCSGFDCDQQTEHFYEAIRNSVKNAKVILLKEIQDNLNTSISNTTSTTLNKYFDDSNECREFLRVQYNLNNLYKRELEMVCKTCKKRTNQLLNEIDSLKSDLESYKEKLKLAEETENWYVGGQAMKMLHIGQNEGSFELYVNAFRPTKEGRTLLSCRHGELSSLHVSWNFFNIESKTGTRSPPMYTYRSNYIYVIPMKSIFLERLQTENITMKIFAMAGPNETLVGAASINFSEVLIFPQNKIQLTTKVMSLPSECDHSYEKYCTCNEIARKPKHLGNLTVWFRLTCEMDVLKTFSNNHWISKSDEHSAKRRQSNEIAKNSKMLMAITIIRLKLNNFEKLKDSETQDILLEYSFLGQRQLRTKPQPLKTDNILFDYKEKFLSNERNYQRLRKILRNTERSIKMVLINPAMTKADGKEDDSHADGAEIGFGLLQLGKIVQNWNESNKNVNFEIPILLKKPPYENIGYLDICIDEMPSLKQLQQHLNKNE